MNKRRILPLTLATLLSVSCCSALSGCVGERETVLKVYSWEEYIDEGGEGSFVYDEGHLEEGETSPILNDSYKAWYKNATGQDLDVETANSMIEDFELWYEHTYKKPIKVEYSTFGTNEDMYNQIILGDQYDLICPSEYMIMKLAAENLLEPFSSNFLDESKAENAYVRNVSPFIKEIFDSHTVTVTDGEGKQTEHAWTEYAAGYFWGTTGLIYNPEEVSASDLTGFEVMLNEKYQNRVTTKDNVRDSYFAGLGILYKEELEALKEDYKTSAISADEYNRKVSEIFNRTDEKSVEEVQKILLQMKENIYGFETDTGKNDLIKGLIALNFAWSGDAVYAMDLAEEKDVLLDFYVPESGSNMFFDGWVMPKGAKTQEAEAFINFMSMPQNAIRNMYYVGYTSVIGTQETFAYADYAYGSEEGTKNYDLSYFFGEGSTLLVEEEQLSRQLYAQYPTEEVMARCAIMDYFAPETNDRINEMWAKIKGATLEPWAIIVICVGVLLIALFILFLKLSGKIDLFRRKPKKGYTLVKQKPLN